ncbi:zinc finger domain-containing protein [Gordonia westfalica]|uniref:zinc finger domain-containing protein n=1 Tax=Gordonia westfalica TaxID=158898 RepID=UPI003CC7A83F
MGAIERPCPECAARPGELCVLRSPATGAEKTRHIPAWGEPKETTNEQQQEGFRRRGVQGG